MTTPPMPSESTAAQAVQPAVPIVDASVPLTPTDADPPVQVLLPDLGVDVAVEPVGIAPDGQMEVPEDALRAGWYRFGPVPGRPGAAVVAAHAGSYITPRGPFFALTRAEVGMRVEVALAERKLTFEVTDVEEVTKDGLDLAPYFDRDGEPRLVLITCGGVWDGDAQSYLSNVIVTARLIDG